LIDFGNNFILNSTEIKLRGKKISKLIDHNLLSRNPFSNGVYRKIPSTICDFQKSCLDALVIGGKMSFWSEMSNFQLKKWNV